MASINNLAKEYADYIRLNSGNTGAIGEIVNRINALAYTESSKKISDEDKIELIDLVEKLLSERRQTTRGLLIKEAEDSTELIKLIKMLKSQTIGK